MNLRLESGRLDDVSRNLFAEEVLEFQVELPSHARIPG